MEVLWILIFQGVDLVLVGVDWKMYVELAVLNQEVS